MKNPFSLPWWIYLLWSLPLGIVIYFGASLMMAAKGFPLDDAYIYYRYVVNLGAGDGLTFNPGEVSFGITSFVYPILCVFVDSFPGIVTIRAMQLVGLLGHLMLVWFAQRLLYSLTENLTVSLVAGFMLATSWPIFMTVPAGLETVLFHGMAVLLLWLVARTPRVHPIWIGVTAGFVFLTRPEGLLLGLGILAFSVLYTVLYERDRWRALLLRCSLMIAGFLAAALPYMLFVYSHIGSFMPSTFTGKLLNRNRFYLWSEAERIRRGVLSIFDGYIEILSMDPKGISLAIFFFLTIGSLMVMCYRMGKGKPKRTWFIIQCILFCMLLFPFVFGYSFHVFPRYGGYAQRYIQFVVVVIHLLGILGLYALVQGCVQWLAPQKQRRWATNGLVALLGIVWFVWVFAIPPSGAISRLHFDQRFLYQNSIEKQGVRMMVADWLRNNTPTNSRVLVGSTGLGVVGSFSERYCKDEAGLINPDIYPYLKQFQMGQQFHWPAMLEYMKAQTIQYYTGYQSIMEDENAYMPSRHMRRVATVYDPALIDRGDLDRFSSAYIYRFTAPEHYELWDDTPEHIELLDRNQPPVTKNRVVAEMWGEYPVVAGLALNRYFELQYPLLFPDHATLKTGRIAQFFKEKIQPGDWAKFNVYVDYHRERTIIHEAEFDLNTLSPGSWIDEIELDLSEWSGKYATLVFAVSTSAQESPVWLGWVRPQLFNKTEPRE